MVELKINSATMGNITNTYADTTIDAVNTDAATGQDETEYQNSKWSTYLGIYKAIPECKIATDTLARWTIGDGYIADPETSVILDHIVGWGTDTFDDILENMDRCASIGGDSFAEIIREGDVIINLKVLDPGSIKIIVDKKGIIKRYEQISKMSGNIVKFNPKDILHLSNKRVADEIHGISDYEALTEILLANKESFTINKQIIKNFSKPKMMVAMDTDDPVKINSFITKFDEATSKGENLFYPKGTIEPQVLAVPSNATLNVLPWREHLKNYFYQVVGIPQVLMGGSGEFSESSTKIAYLSFEQVVKQRQRYIITQVWNQMFLRIDLAMPASLKNEMLSSQAKDGQNARMDLQANDVTAGVGK